jgi:uncharacterized protein YbjT (DUF2867 family)/quercetin dioxygenase-like cupin family protein
VKPKVHKNEIANEPNAKKDTTMKTNSSSNKTRMNKMKIVVIGGTGLIGARLVKNLQDQGHEVMPASPSSGVNTLTGEGLADALRGAQVVVDVANAPSWEDKAVLEFFETSGRNLLAAETAAGVKHHVALSVVGTDRLLASGYFRAKMAQEKLIQASEIPYTIVRSTQFFEFARGLAQSAADGATVRLSSVLMQPIVSDDVAAALADVAVGEPMNGTLEIAGPEQIRQDEFVRQYLSATGDTRQVITDVHAGYYGVAVNDQSLVPGPNPRLGSIRFAEWLGRNTSQKPAAQQSTSNRPAKVATVAALLLCGIVILALSLRSAAADASSTNDKEAKLTELFSKDLKDLPGKEGLMLMVEYPPGSLDPMHRHNAHGFIYLLEGSIIMQVRGGKEVTLTPGQTFYEGPEDVHVVGRNASQTKPAKFVVFFVKNKGTPVLEHAK